MNDVVKAFTFVLMLSCADAELWRQIEDLGCVMGILDGMNDCRL